MDVQRHKNNFDHVGDDEAPHDMTESNVSMGIDAKPDQLASNEIDVKDQKMMIAPTKEVEMTKLKTDSAAEEKRSEILKHISLGDLTKTDPE